MKNKNHFLNDFLFIRLAIKSNSFLLPLLILFFLILYFICIDLEKFSQFNIKLIKPTNQSLLANESTEYIYKFYVSFKQFRFIKDQTEVLFKINNVIVPFKILSVHKPSKRSVNYIVFVTSQLKNPFLIESNNQVNAVLFVQNPFKKYFNHHFNHAFI